MRRLTQLTVVLLLVLAGCGSSKSSSSSAPSSAAGSSSTVTTPSPSRSSAKSVSVGENEYTLTPSHPTVGAGSVSFTVHNSGKVVHALEIENAGPGGKDLRSSVLSPGSTTTIVAHLKPGKTYEFYCPIDGHKRLGMKGTLTVSKTGSASAPPSTSTTSSSSGAGSSYGY